MGRMLGPEQFGVFGSLFGLFYLLGILGAGFGFVSTRYVSTHEGAELKGFLRGFATRVLVLTAVLFIALTLALPYLSSFLKIDDPLLIMIVIAAPLIGLFNAVNNGAMRGLQRFVAVGSIGAGTAFLKLVGGVALVFMGFGVYGALGAVAGATVAATIATILYLRRLYFTGEGGFGGHAEVYRYAVPTILFAFCFNVPANADVVIVKSLFSSSTAGVYTSITVLGKIMVFLPTGIAGAMFPKVSEREVNGETTTRLLGKALLFTGGIAFTGAALYGFFPGTIISLFFGQSYSAAAELLPWYGVAIAVFSMAIVTANYALARNETSYIKVFSGLTVAEIFLMYLLGDTVLNVIQVILAVNLVALFVGIALFFKGGEL